MDRAGITTVVGITGGQGVGKSTFAAGLQSWLADASRADVTLVAGLGARLQASGVPFGSAADARSVAAIYCAHLERELALPVGIVILDRCCVDALCYVRALRVTDPSLDALYRMISRAMARRLALAIHLEMTGIFSTTEARHETPELRRAVADDVCRVIAELDVEALTFEASRPGALELAGRRVLALHARRSAGY
jgi:predicted ATPase